MPPSPKTERFIGYLILLVVSGVIFVLCAVQCQAQLVSAEREAAFRQLLPEVETDEYQEMLDDPELLFYDDRSRPKVYQNMASVHAASYNISGGRHPYGNGNYEMPWGETAGTHLNDDIWSYKAIWLPKREDGTRWPIVWWQDIDHSRRIRLGESRRIIRWRFPRNTTVFEFLVWRHGGYDWPFVALARDIEIPGQMHGIAAFQPCATLESYRTAVVELLGDPKAEEHMRQIRYTEPERIADVHGRFSETTRVMVLPRIGEDVARKLLSRRWELSIDTGFRPTGPGSLQIVPPRFRHSHVERTRESCARCHSDTLVNVSFFQPRVDWYGCLRGSDGIFSFYPFDYRCASHTGFNKPIRMDQRLIDAGIVAKRNRSEHPAEVYGKN
jgi:hypothetical protein